MKMHVGGNIWKLVVWGWTDQNAGDNLTGPDILSLGHHTHSQNNYCPFLMMLPTHTCIGWKWHMITNIQTIATIWVKVKV